MRKMTLRFMVFMTILAVMATSLPTSAIAGEKQLGAPTPGNTFIDAVVYRPLGLVAIPVGAVLFIVSLPFSATGGNVKQSFHNLVIEPAKYTFNRPLGAI